MREWGFFVEETDEIPGSRPIGVLIIHVFAYSHVDTMQTHGTARYAANICLIPSIKGRPVYPSHFGRSDVGGSREVLC